MAARRLLRQLQGSVFWGLCALALGLIVAPALWIVVGLLKESLPVLDLKLITQNTVQMGLQNAILGTLLLDLGVLLVAGPIGVAAGTYLAEFAKPNAATWLRFSSEVLAGIPSIVIGYVAWVTLVVGFHWGYSLLAGVLALSAIVTPYIVRTTEVSLRQVPTSLRDGARALGLPASTSLRKVIFPPAVPGILSGLVVAIAISSGETAPLLYTVGFSNANPTPNLLGHPLGYLTYVVFTNVQLPSHEAHQLANAAAALSLVFLLLLLALGRLLTRRAARITARMAL